MTEADGPAPAGDDQPSFVGSALVVLALWGLAGVQPLLELFGKNAEFFLASGTGPGEIVAFALVVAFGVPIVLIALDGLLRLVRPSVAVAVHLGAVAVLGALFGLNVARQVGLDALVPAILIAIGTGALAVWIRSKPTPRTALHYLAVTPLAFLLLFVFGSDANSLIFSDDAEVVELEAGRGGPVAVIVFDELPLASLLTVNAEVNPQRFPNFARLAAMSTWYRNATAVNPSTPDSVPTVLTGEYPQDGLLPTSADRPINLFTLLGGDYEVRAFEGITDLCPDDVCAPILEPDVDTFFADLTSALGDAGVVYGHLTLPEPLRDDLPTLGQAWAGFLDQPSRPDAASPEEVDEADERDDLSDFLSGRASEARERGGQGLDMVPLVEGYDGEDGSLLVGHDPFVPHRPWHLSPTGRLYDGAVGGVVPGQEEWPGSPAFLRRVLQRHLLQVGWADNLLGRLLDRFEAAGTLEEATIVVTADHGMAFQLGGRARDPNESNVHEIYRVPLFIKGPGQGAGDGAISDQNALLVDVLPTVLDLIDVEPPADADFDGQSLVDPGFDRPEDRKPVFYGAGPSEVPGNFAEVLPVVLRNVAYVGDGGWLDLLRVGPAGRYVGRPLTGVNRTRPVPGAWSIDQEELFDVPEGPVRPLAISGRLELDDPVRLPNQVLVAVDGVLAGVGDLNRDDGHFAALLDERRVTPGPHEVELFLPLRPGRLTRIMGG